MLCQSVAEGTAEFGAHGLRHGNHNAVGISGGVALRTGDEGSVVGRGVIDSHRLVQVRGHDGGVGLHVVVKPHHLPVHAVLIGRDIGGKSHEVVRGKGARRGGAVVERRFLTGARARHRIHQCGDGEGQVGCLGGGLSRRSQQQGGKWGRQRAGVCRHKDVLTPRRCPRNDGEVNAGGSRNGRR